MNFNFKITYTYPYTYNLRFINLWKCIPCNLTCQIKLVSRFRPPINILTLSKMPPRESHLILISLSPNSLSFLLHYLWDINRSSQKSLPSRLHTWHYPSNSLLLCHTIDPIVQLGGRGWTPEAKVPQHWGPTARKKKVGQAYA